MKKLLLCLMLVAVMPLFVSAGEEPPAPRTIPQKVRFSTHVVVGEVQGFRVINETTGSAVPNPSAVLKVGQRIELEIVVREVLQTDRTREVTAGSRLKVRFGDRGYTPSVFKGMLGGTRIYFLSRDAEHGAHSDYFFPFYGDSNLTAPVDQLNAVMIAVAKLRDASE